MNLENQQLTLKTLLVEDLEAGIEQFQQLLASASDLRNEVILLRARFEQLQQDINRSVLSVEQRNIVLNRIRATYLSLVDKLDQDDFSADSEAPEATTATTVAVGINEDFYKQDCTIFLQHFKTQLNLATQTFQSVYDETGKHMVDFGKLFQSIGQMISSKKVEEGQEEAYHQRFQIAFRKATSRLNLFGEGMEKMLVQTKAANGQLISQYQQLIYFLDFPNATNKSPECQQGFRYQLAQLNTLKARSESFLNTLNFVDQLEAMAYIFKIDDALSAAFSKVLLLFKEFHLETNNLCKQSKILAAELEFSIDELQL